MKAITTQKLTFPTDRRRITPECKKLMTGMLSKAPAGRLKLNEILQSDWLQLSYSRDFSSAPHREERLAAAEEASKKKLLEEAKLPLSALPVQKLCGSMKLKGKVMPFPMSPIVGGAKPGKKMSDKLSPRFGQLMPSGPKKVRTPSKGQFFRTPVLLPTPFPARSKEAKAAPK